MAGPSAPATDPASPARGPAGTGLAKGAAGNLPAGPSLLGVALGDPTGLPLRGRLAARAESQLVFGRSAGPVGWASGARGRADAAETGAPPSARVDGPARPAPQGAGLLTSLLPFGREAIDDALDRLLDRADDLGLTRPGVGAATILAHATLTAALAVLAGDLALRLRRGPGARLDDEVGAVLMPGLPGLRR